MGLLLAGFFVGRGVSTEMKAETTVASTRLETLRFPLGPEWIEKLGHSSVKRPYGDSTAPDEEISLQIRNHPQFAGSAM